MHMANEVTNKELLKQLEKVETWAQSVKDMAGTLQQECHKARMLLGGDSSLPVRKGFKKSVQTILNKRVNRIHKGQIKNQRASAGLS